MSRTQQLQTALAAMHDKLPEGSRAAAFLRSSKDINWDAFIEPFPTTIQLIGKLLLLSASHDFELEQPKGGLVKCPKSFRATLVQIGNGAREALMSSLSDMDAILLAANSTMNTMRKIGQVLQGGIRDIDKLPPYMEELDTDIHELIARSNKIVDVHTMVLGLLYNAIGIVIDNSAKDGRDAKVAPAAAASIQEVLMQAVKYLSHLKDHSTQLTQFFAGIANRISVVTRTALLSFHKYATNFKIRADAGALGPLIISSLMCIFTDTSFEVYVIEFIAGLYVEVTRDHLLTPLAAVTRLAMSKEPAVANQESKKLDEDCEKAKGLVRARLEAEYKKVETLLKEKLKFCDEVAALLPAPPAASHQASARAAACDDAF